jgi:hypothetical protein
VRREGFSGLAAEAVARFGQFRIQARGNSMRPLIPDGTVVTLRPALREIHPGDIVAIDLGARLVVHRVLSNRDGWIQTAGDSNRKADPKRPVADVIGVVSHVQLPNGWFQRVDSTSSRFLGRLIVCIQRRRLSVV